MIIDHIGLAVSDYSQSKAFFNQSLAPLGISLITEVAGRAGFGKDGKPEFWFGTHAKIQAPMHIAFSAGSRAQVNAFYAAALKAGAKDNGPPGIREIYHPNYYGAFVICPDGHNIEAVCHQPDAPKFRSTRTCFASWLISTIGTVNHADEAAERSDTMCAVRNGVRHRMCGA